MLEILGVATLDRPADPACLFPTASLDRPAAPTDRQETLAPELYYKTMSVPAPSPAPQWGPVQVPKRLGPSPFVGSFCWFLVGV